MSAGKGEGRRQQILESLAQELELNPGARITTAALARRTGVSEAALYRHFPSKARMYEGLIGFAEESVFSRVNQIMRDEKSAPIRCGRILYLLLAFSANNPGITRVLLGDALVGERDRLQVRVDQFFSRIEAQFKQILREAVAREPAGKLPVEADVGANLLLALVEGRMHQYLRSRFSRSPLEGWELQWALLRNALFVGSGSGIA